jgi:hypothetical protein
MLNQLKYFGYYTNIIKVTISNILIIFFIKEIEIMLFNNANNVNFCMSKLFIYC